MQSVPPRPNGRSRGGEAVEHAARFVDDESLVIRNYDGAESHEVAVRFVDADDDPAFERTYELGPGEVVSTRTRLPRAVYEVTVRLNDGPRERSECLIGSGPSETAVVETGNGVVSVVEGIV
jgi:hypothetical protein